MCPAGRALPSGAKIRLPNLLKNTENSMEIKELIENYLTTYQSGSPKVRASEATTSSYQTISIRVTQYIARRLSPSDAFHCLKWQQARWKIREVNFLCADFF
jgi:hypothetical protein